MTAPPPEPAAPTPAPDDPRTPLMHRVKEALMALPGYFNWWQHVRNTKANRAIVSPAVEAPYRQRSNTSDKPAYDGGGNFGRIARIGIMNDWTQDILQRPLAGIAARQWIEFLKSQAS